MWKNHLFGIPGIALGLLLLGNEPAAAEAEMLPSVATISAQTGDSNALAFTVIAITLGAAVILVGVLLWMKWKKK